jgi:hypothetical protein
VWWILIYSILETAYVLNESQRIVCKNTLYAVLYVWNLYSWSRFSYRAPNISAIYHATTCPSNDTNLSRFWSNSRAMKNHRLHYSCWRKGEPSTSCYLYIMADHSPRHHFGPFIGLLYLWPSEIAVKQLPAVFGLSCKLEQCLSTGDVRIELVVHVGSSGGTARYLEIVIFYNLFKKITFNCTKMKTIVY